MKQTRKIALPGRGKGRNAPSGYLVGRASRGRGPLELMDAAGLAAVGIATKASQNAQAAQCGFRFFVGGRPGAGEKIGQGVWGHPVAFENGQSPASVVTSVIPAASTAVWHIETLIAGVWSVIGTITFSTASFVGVLNWTAAVTIPSGQPVALYAPASQDATMADISGSIYGSTAI
jgi:hypothetical protein